MLPQAGAIAVVAGGISPPRFSATRRSRSVRNVSRVLERRAIHKSIDRGAYRGPLSIFVSKASSRR